MLSKYILAIAFTFLFAFKTSFAQEGTINITVQGLSNTKGNLCIALCDNEKDFSSHQENAKIKKIIPIKDKKVTLSLNNVKYGVYALAIIHDENKNNKMDYHFFGYPVEGYGVSNNVKSKFSPPSFDKSKFILNSESKSLIIDIHYFVR